LNIYRQFYKVLLLRLKERQYLSYMLNFNLSWRIYTLHTVPLIVEAISL